MNARILLPALALACSLTIACSGSSNESDDASQAVVAGPSSVETHTLLENEPASDASGPIASWKVEFTNTPRKNYIHVVGSDHAGAVAYEILMFDFTTTSASLQFVRSQAAPNSAESSFTSEELSYIQGELGVLARRMGATDSTTETAAGPGAVTTQSQPLLNCMKDVAAGMLAVSTGSLTAMKLAVAADVAGLDAVPALALFVGAQFAVTAGLVGGAVIGLIAYDECRAK